MTLADLDEADAFLRDFATRHGIRRLAWFGSVLRGEETPASDIDLLGEFEEGRTPGLLSMAKMELELGAVVSVIRQGVSWCRTNQWSPRR